MKRSLIISILVLSYFSTMAQISQPKRYELEIKDINDDHYIISAEYYGLYLCKQLFKKNTFKERVWQVIRLDTALNEVSKLEVTVDSKFIFKGYSYNNGKFAMLFQEGSEIAKDLLFVLFDAETDTFETYSYDNVVPIILSEFELKDDAVVFGGDVNYRAVLILYNFNDKKGVVLPGFYTDRSSLLQIVTETEDNLIKIVTNDRRFNKSYGINIRTYTTQGEYLGVKEFDGEGDISLIDGRIVSLNRSESILAGTYSRKRTKSSSRGIFLSSSFNAEENKVSYYNYGELDNFFNYLKEKKRNRIKEKIKRKKIKGKKMQFRYRLFVHDIIRENNENILVGEAYYPTYRSNVNDFGNYDPFAYRSTRQVFDGYKYTHAIIIGFNDEGKILWDNSFEINDLKSFYLEDQVHAVIRKDQIIMLYLYKQDLKIKIIKGQEIIEPKFSESLKLKHSADEIRAYNEEIENLEKWYGDTFFAYGSTRVKNLSDGDIELNRKVFFINKIVVE